MRQIKLKLEVMYGFKIKYWNIPEELRDEKDWKGIQIVIGRGNITAEKHSRDLG